MSSLNQKIPALDGLRGLAISLVLMWHYIPCQLIGNLAPGSWQSYARKYLASTWTGVDLFFVLSGFLMFRLFFQNGLSVDYLKTFYIRRACRILPLYFCLLLSFLVFQNLASESTQYDWLLKNPMPLWSYLVFVQNWFMGFAGDVGARWLGATWSLAVEEQFYLMIPFLFFLYLKSRTVYSILGAWVFCVFLRNTGWFGFHEFSNTFLRLDCLLLGGLVCILRWRFANSPLLVFLSNLTFCGLGILLAAQLYEPKIDFWGFWDVHLFYGIFFSALLLVILSSEGFCRRLFSMKLLRFLGKLSFGLYLFHEPISGVLHGAIFSSSPSLASTAKIVTTLVAFLLSLLIATILNKLVEEPFIRFGKKVSPLTPTQPRGALVFEQIDSF